VCAYDVVHLTAKPFRHALKNVWCAICYLLLLDVPVCGVFVTMQDPCIPPGEFLKKFILGYQTTLFLYL
jgi:hypothetical protein